jgi:tRNA A37 threonylcarbamoyladenosine biosynthesis protein TsaE
MENLFIKVKRMIIEVARQEESEKIAAFLAERIKESWRQDEVAQRRGQRELALNKDFPWVILLDGDLGAGKTTFTQALAKEMGLEEPVTSPTFNLVN